MTVNTRRATAAKANEERLNDALIISHATLHELIERLTLRVDSVPATKDDGASWGDVGDMAYMIEKLRDALGDAS